MKEGGLRIWPILPGGFARCFVPDVLNLHVVISLNSVGAVIAGLSEIDREHAGTGRQLGGSDLAMVLKANAWGEHARHQRGPGN